jgi:hypothetical protein
MPPDIAKQKHKASARTKWIDCISPPYDVAIDQTILPQGQNGS